jgi:hypothetical protein
MPNVQQVPTSNLRLSHAITLDISVAWELSSTKTLDNETFEAIKSVLLDDFNVPAEHVIVTLTSMSTKRQEEVVLTLTVLDSCKLPSLILSVLRLYR